MGKAQRQRKRQPSLRDIVDELDARIRDMDAKLNHLIRSFRRFNHVHFDSVDESV